MLQCKEYKFDNRIHWIIFSFLKQLAHFTLNCYDNYVIWFCDYHALIPILFARLYHRKSFVIVGGFDAMSLPEIGYGVFRKRDLRQLIVRWSYHLCTKILPVDQTLRDEIKKRMNLPQSKFQTINTGVDLVKWRSEPIGRDIDFLTVANINNQQTYLRKGIDKFIHMANMMPTKEFVIIGWQLPMVKHSVNLTILFYTVEEVVKEMMNRSKVYCQLSMAEGIPNTLIEAMAMGCVPCVTNVNGMPWLVKDTGIVIEYLADTRSALYHALRMTNEKSLERVKIMNHENRKRKFEQAGIL